MFLNLKSGSINMAGPSRVPVAMRNQYGGLGLAVRVEFRTVFSAELAVEMPTPQKAERLALALRALGGGSAPLAGFVASLPEGEGRKGGPGGGCRGGSAAGSPVPSS